MSQKSTVPTPTEQSGIPISASGTLDPESLYATLTLHGTDIPAPVPSPPTTSPESRDHPTDGGSAMYGVAVYTSMNEDEFLHLEPEKSKFLAVVLKEGKTWAGRLDRHTQKIERKQRVWPVNDYNASLRWALKRTIVYDSDSKVKVLDSPALSQSEFAETGFRMVTEEELVGVERWEAYLKGEARRKRRADRLSRKARDEEQEATLEESLANVTVGAPGTAS